MATRERFVSKKLFLFLFSLASIIQGMYSTYFVSTLTTIERLYEIQSKTVGAIMSATEFGQILGSLLVSYYGGKGNKPKWITVCMTLSALAAIISTSPHFIMYINQQQHNILQDNNLQSNNINFNYNNNNQIKTSNYQQQPNSNNNEQHQLISYSFALGQGQLCSSVIPVSAAAAATTSARAENSLHLIASKSEWPIESLSQSSHHHQQSFASASFKKQPKLKQPTEIIFVIFFFSLLVIGFGSTAMTTLGIPFIDDIVSREESPLYLGVTIGLRIFGPALGFLLGSLCIQLNVDFPFNTGTIDQADPVTSINWIGAWWLGLIIISIPLLLLAMPMYYFSLLAKNSTNNKKINTVSNMKRNSRQCVSEHKLAPDHIDDDLEEDDDVDDGHDIDEKMIASSVPTSLTPSPTNNHHHNNNQHIANYHNHQQHRYIEYRLNDAYVDHERFPSIMEVTLSNAPSNDNPVEQNQIKSNLLSLDTSNLLSLNITKSQTTPITNLVVHEQICDDADSVLTKSSLDLSHSGSSTTSNQIVQNQLYRERRHRYLSSSTSASSSDHHNQHEHLKHRRVQVLHENRQKQKKQLKHNNKINNLSNSIRRLIRNRVFMLRLASSVLHILPIAGFYTFLPKYLIEQFKVGASAASAISGLAGILFVGLGAFIGGSLMRVFNVNSKCVTRWIASSALAYAIGMLILMQLGCPQENLVTYDLTIKDRSYIDHQHPQQPHLSCSSSCNCRQSVYNPICVQQTTYLSPCLAGCTNYTQSDNQRITYNDCKCHITTATADYQNLLAYNIDDLSVTSGPCRSDCGNLKWYIIMFSLFVLIHATCEVGSMMLNLRCVDSKDRALALGMITFASSLLGTIPCSIIYGAVIDLTCIYWETSEPESSSLISSATIDQTTFESPSRGACRVYDNDRFRFYLHGLTALVMIFAFIIDSIICKQASKINFFQQSPLPRSTLPSSMEPNTTTTTLKAAANKQLNNEIIENHIDQDDEDDGVVGHMSEDDELDCKLHQLNQHQVTIDCAEL